MNETNERTTALDQHAAAIADYITMVGCWHTSNGNWIFYRQELEHHFPFVDFSKRHSDIIDHILTHLITYKEVLDVEIESDPDTDEFECFDVIFGLAYCPHAETSDSACAVISKEDDMVNHPSHYTQGGIECIEAIRASMPPSSFQGYCKGNVMKYIWRASLKNGVEDLKKAQVYLGWMIESMEKANE